MKRVIFLLFIFYLPIVSWIGARSYYWIQFERKCGGHLNLAKNAMSVEFAREELDIAIDYLEKTAKISGNTDPLLLMPSRDLSRFYKNLLLGKRFLSSVENGSTIDKINSLQIIKHSILEAEIPDGISVHPYNGIYFWSLLLSLALGIIGFFYIINLDENGRLK